MKSKLPACFCISSAFGEMTTSPPRSRRSRHLAECGRNAKACWQLRLHSGHGLRESRHERLPQFAAPRREHHARRRAGKASRRFSIRVDYGPPKPLRFADWRHTGNPGDARLLRTAQYHCGCRSDPDPESQRGLRETPEVGCEVPLLDRYGFLEMNTESDLRTAEESIESRGAGETKPWKSKELARNLRPRGRQSGSRARCASIRFFRRLIRRSFKAPASRLTRARERRGIRIRSARLSASCL